MKFILKVNLREELKFFSLFADNHVLAEKILVAQITATRLGLSYTDGQKISANIIMQINSYFTWK